MFKTYNLFNHRNIDDLMPEIVYYYLFKGLSLTAIEEKLFMTDRYHGWLSKTFLNYFGIDTEDYMRIEQYLKLLRNFTIVRKSHI